jgi:hypothetical protein
MGLDVYIPALVNHETGELNNSALYPNHLYKLGYFRSSYNSVGFNFIANMFDNPDLYEIFRPPASFEFLPDYASCRVRALAGVRLWKLREPKNPLSLRLELSSGNPEYRAIELTEKIAEEISGEERINHKIITPVDYRWYIQAAEIVLETIEFILDQERLDGFIMQWSG